MTISIKATRSQTSLDATSISGPTTVLQGSSNSYTITDFDSFAVYSIIASAGTVTRSGQTITLVIAANEPATTMQLTITRDDSSVVKNIAIGVQTIGTPSITSPASGSTNVSLPVTLLATDFVAYPSGADTHKSSDWRVKDGAGTVIWSSVGDTVNKTSITVPQANLSPGTQYFADVRYNGNTLGSSQYSAANQFTTSSVSIVRPSITSPVSGATNIGNTPTFTSSAFSTAPTGSDTHASSNWRVKNVSTGVTVWSSLNDTVNKTSITVPSGILITSTQYSVEVQYNGNTLPTSQWSPVVTFTTASAFEYGKYLGALVNSTAFAQVYGQDVDTFTRVADLSTATNQAPRRMAFSPDGNYLAVVGNGTLGRLVLYKRSGDVFSKIANPSSPGSSCNGLSFSPDGNYLAVAITSSPFMIVYKRSGDTFSVLPNPSSLPSSEGLDAAFGVIESNLYLTIGTTSSPHLKIYSVNTATDTFTSVTNPSVSPGGPATSVCFSSDGAYMGVGGSTSPFLNIYKGTGFTRLPNPSNLPPDNCLDIAMSQNCTYLAVALVVSPFIYMYKRSGDTFSKLPDPSPLPSGISRGIAFSADGNYLAVGCDASPFLIVYKRSGDTWTKLANPATLPTNAVYSVAFNPPLLGV